MYDINHFRSLIFENSTSHLICLFYIKRKIVKIRKFGRLFIFTICNEAMKWITGLVDLHHIQTYGFCFNLLTNLKTFIVCEYNRQDHKQHDECLFCIIK